MKRLDLPPFAAAITERLCVPCADGDDEGRCCRPGAQPCALTAHADLLVQAFTSLGRGKTPDEYSSALERLLCPLGRRDETGYCSLLALIIDVPDERLMRIVRVILDTDDAARRA